MGFVHLDLARVPASDHPLQRPSPQLESQLKGKRGQQQPLAPKFAEQCFREAKCAEKFEDTRVLASIARASTTRLVWVPPAQEHLKPGQRCEA